MPTPYRKYAGAGNAFIIIDDRDTSFPLQSPKNLIPPLCSEHHVDGVILLQAPSTSNAHYRMRIFNADGSEAEMCGNGIRCLARFLQDIHLYSDKYLIESLAAIHTIYPKDNGYFEVSMGEAKDIRWDLTLTIQQENITVHSLDTGVPHAVTFSSLFNLAPQIRHHARFAPRGVNVNFIKKLPSGAISIRTYERGVEGETLACGTGATASAIVAARCLHLPSPITVITASTEALIISLEPTLTMCGPTKFISSGSLHLAHNLHT